MTGSIYLVTLFILFVIGIYVFFKREWPEFFSTKMFGFYLFVIGFLTLMHWEFVSLNSGNTSMIFKETINQLIKGFNGIMSSGGISSDITVGGGIIGGVFALLFSKLFSITGMKIVTITLIVVGICMFTGFSIVDFLHDRFVYVHEEIHKKKEKENE